MSQLFSPSFPEVLKFRLVYTLFFIIYTVVSDIHTILMQIDFIQKKASMNSLSSCSYEEVFPINSSSRCFLTGALVMILIL